MDLQLIRKRCWEGRSIITSRTSSSGVADPTPARPLRRRAPCGPLGFARNPLIPCTSLLYAPWELSVVLGERNREREVRRREQARQRGEKLRMRGWPAYKRLQNSAGRRGGKKSLLGHLIALRQLTWFPMQDASDTSLSLKAHTSNPTHLSLLSPGDIQPARSKKEGARSWPYAPALGKEASDREKDWNWPRKQDYTKTLWETQGV